MQTNHLRHFITVAEKGSISAAASTCFITPQGLSRSISALEGELGCPLFRKSHKGMALTEFGKALLPEARAIVAAEKRMIELTNLVRDAGEASGAQEITMFLNNIAFDVALMSPLLESFENVFSNARYFQLDNEEVVRKLVECADDDGMVLGLVALFSVNHDENALMVAELAEHGYEYYGYLETYDEVLVAADSPLAAKNVLSRSDILTQPIVSSDGDIRRVCEKVFGTDAIYMVTSDSSFRFRMVANNEAITFVPAFYRTTYHANSQTAIVPMRDPYFVEVGFVGKPEVLENPYVKRVIGQLNSHYARFRDMPYLSLVPSQITEMPGVDEGGEVSEERLVALADENRLNEREREVLAFLAQGLSTREIANRLRVSTRTVKSCSYGIYNKLGVHSQKELMHLFRM